MGLDKVLKRLEKLKDVDTKLAPAIKKATLKVEARAKRETPVNMGALRGSIESKFKVQKNVLTARISPGEKYAKYVHEGTGSLAGGRDRGFTPGRIRSGTVKKGIGGIRPNKFMKRAADWAAVEDVFMKTISKEISKLIK